MAQSTFYVHFRDRDELLQELADWLTVGRHQAVREARRVSGETRGASTGSGPRSRWRSTPWSTALDVVMRLVTGLTPLIDRHTLSVVVDE